MTKAIFRAGIALSSGLCIGSPLLADPPPPTVPQVQFVDSIGTDLISMAVYVPAPRIDVPGFSFGFSPILPPYRHNHSDAITVSEDPFVAITHVQVTFEGKSYQFAPAYGGATGLWIFAPERQTQGAILTQINSTTYQLTTPEGTIVTYDATFRSSEYALTSEPSLLSGSPDEPGFFATAVSATRADGEKIDYYYSPGQATGLKTLKAIRSSLGWTTKVESQYISRAFNQFYRTGAETTKAYMVNDAVDYCDPLAASCLTSSGLARREINISTSDGFEFIYKNKSGEVIFRHKYSTPGGVSGWYLFPSGRNLTFPRPGFGLLPVPSSTSVQAGSSAWTYQGSPADYTGANNIPLLYTSTRTSVDPDGKTKTVKFYWLQEVPIEITDERGFKTVYQFDGGRYLTRAISAEATYSGSTLTGGYVEYSYDTRRNLTQIRSYPKGGGIPLVQSFEYETACDASNFRVCNKVKSYTDQNGNVSTYAYSAVHGGLVSETYPADANGVKKQVRYSYQQMYPSIALSGSGTTNGTPVWRVSSRSECTTASASDPASCVGTVNEIIDEYTYNPQNVTLASKRIKRGDSTVLGTEYYTYGYFGERTSVTTLRTDVNTTRYYVYDPDGRLTYEISPDPDGTGPLLRKVVKHVYDADGRESETQDGYGAMTNGSDFIWQKKVRISYDLSTGKIAKRETVTP